MASQTFQNNNIYRDFDLSFGQNPLTNDVSKKTDVNSINQALRTLLNTCYYERPFRPDVGSRLRNLLFEPADPVTVLDIKSGIEEVIINHEPRVNVRSIKVTDRSELNAYAITIEYSINMSKETQEFKVTLKRLR